MFERLDANSDWSRAEIEEHSIELYLFGAGHVGRSLVRVLADLPVNLHWIDTRDGMLPEVPPAGVETICTDTPEAEIDAAPAGSYFLVMTHDHALDQCLCEQILKRDDFDYFGLIGSASKRRNFETRMRRRGVDASRFAAMTCPIGVDGISGKQPAQIAIAVAAEILQVYDRRQSAARRDDKITSISRGYS
jgi:xanthine dehydrogenase accessory factor